MSSVWDRSERASCTHPGWTTLRGWAAVVASFAALFQSGTSIQFILTDEEVHLAGDVAWVTVDENILGGQTGAMAAAVNLFVRTGEGWRMVVHHGSPVSTGEVPDD